MSSHPGATLKDAVKLAEFIKKEHLHPEQVQDYYPTPGTISTAMFYTELDPYTLEPVYVAKNPHDKAMQRALMQYFNPKNYDLVEEALKRAGRQDLIGLGSNCLIKPRPGTKQTKAKQSYGKNGNNRYGKRRKTNKKQILIFAIIAVLFMVSVVITYFPGRCFLLGVRFTVMPG